MLAFINIMASSNWIEPLLLLQIGIGPLPLLPDLPGRSQLWMSKMEQFEFMTSFETENQGYIM